ncbi:ATP-dependent DNA helicase [Halobellus clavatus]|uniref:DNA excision repair protein ERCC-2 n=1 Tax=Halobellus clavatus TaxID=660517 RepID=A0A1H3CGV5_9EURY|nr:ATP-dependent DNA helicase [Halobellus clavatus]SDX53387.1 DNA excision repair protein ERCC-2 [Halobellus clavatus]
MNAAQRLDDVSWQAVFGHDEPYPEQADGIDAAIEAAADDGFLVVEGACGTGKTMLALTAGIDRVRDPDSTYERVVVLTSVKQQLRQFEADLQTINGNLPEDWRPVSGLTLVGKADVCPYSRANVAGIDDETVYDRCEGLRDRTRNLVGEDGATSAGALVSEARSTQTGLLDSGATDGPAYLSAAGEPTPYLPETADYEDTEYCPFYATFLDDLPEDGEPIEAVPFDLTDRGHIDTEELVQLSAGYGTCPHSVMGAVLPHVEVVLGNYYHAFDPQTVGSFTGALVDEETFVVCDEAHMLEPRVRDLVSDGVGMETLRDAEQELTRVIQPVAFEESGSESTQTENADAALIRGELGDADVTLSELREVREFVSDLRSEIDRRVKAHLDRTLPDWRADLTRLDDDELPLRDPEEPAVDELTEWAADAGYDEGTWVRAEAVGAVVARILNEAEDEDVRRAAPAAGRTLANWARTDHVSYFREIELSRTWDETERENAWRRAYNARLALHNCVPGEAIADRLGEFGGGVLMSATLEPMDVFREVTGLDALADAGRPVEERTYGLSFPETNRASFAVDVPKFTHENRGGRGESNPTRQAHVDAVVAIARSPGNVLVGMPNYAEAAWMAEGLRDELDRPVLLDESSGDDETEALKAEFFGGEPKVLVTSLRGTLTEGVDYRGDRLAAAAVCGVPLIDTSSPRTRALRTAYDRRFGSEGQSGRSGFETALTVPAVRKARQAIGRVIRGPDEVGIRALVDARYARASWDSVREYLPETEREEFDPVSSDLLGYGVEQFWSTVDSA